ncbi:prepilin-type N-terminal cleavage/methylation domain-containing protein [Desulfopila sp. IMCC35006]|uniref:pilus assembly FimT family protein n=1 Tax=Desulfopila sp. IMCC35006 TaxID=2569542 RepID=UPI0010AB8957|nr:prepilin-type N-terminal cleavage/methylation domain-containing protein [Desulfopila sp. IMCC35006]TKB28301.1 prepilin-type N-terminal cleavage/methylation domain-containing protein [Desulfopila sp. IMCC35006]
MSRPLQRTAWGRREKEQGFTLIEMVVVVFLIGIMLSVSIPSLRNTFFTDPLKATTRKIIGMVAGVRELAARTQQPYLLHFSRLENRIWYEKDVAEKETKDLGNLPSGQLLLPESVKISGVWLAGEEGAAEDNNSVWISKQGYLIDTIIRIEDDQGNHLNVHFYPFLDTALVADDLVP